MSNQEMLEQAGAQVRLLAEGAGIRPIAMAVDLTDVGRELLPSMLSHQLVADHAVKMRLVARLDRLLGRMGGEQPEAEQGRDAREVAQLCAATARFTERYRQGLLSLARLQRWPGMAPTPRGKPAKAEEDDDDPMGDGPDGGPAGGKSMVQVLSELQSFNRSAESLLKDLDRAGIDTSMPAAPAKPAAPLTNRGRLRHGNPSGDVLASPRCGAKCRSGGACRQPAMKNGRCRLHGGKSTGARTAAGLTRCRTATLVHGHRSAEVIQLKSDLARSGRRLAALTRLAKAANRKSERPTPCPATTTGSVHAEPRRQERGRDTPRGAVVLSFSASSASPRPYLQSERPTPCPARLGNWGPPATSPHRRAATG